MSYNHPDLPNTRQVRLNGSDFTVTPPGNDPSPAGNDNHGNACAGIIAATHNNEGISGIAPNCKIIPIRIPFDVSYNPAPIYAAAIIFAADKGADVISNSWGSGSSNPNYEPVIVDAIRYATTSGRNKKGCVVVFSAGNTANHAGSPSDAGFVSFPANVNIAGVLTVGASDRNDFQANYSPTSNLNSVNNQIIDVVAPSSSTLADGDVWSIDIVGSAGYNTAGFGPLPGITNNDAYTAHFGGTSAACPQVAGVAALILSIHPDLTQTQVASIIMSTARKARNNTTYNYQSGYPNGTWNAQMGYGVVDVTAALNAVPPVIIGVSGLCPDGTFSINNGQSAIWSVSSGYKFTYNEGYSVTVKGNPTNGQSGVLTAVVNGVTCTKNINSCPGILGPDYVFACGTTTFSYTDGDAISWQVSSSNNVFTVVFSDATKIILSTTATNEGGAILAFRSGGGTPVIKTIYAKACNSPASSPQDDSLSESDILVYPNPVSGILTVGIDATSAQKSRYDPVYDLRLYDGQGNLLQQQQTKGGTVQFNVSNLPAGIYYLHIYDGVKSMPVIQQIVVEH